MSETPRKEPTAVSNLRSKATSQLPLIVPWPENRHIIEHIDAIETELTQLRAERDSLKTRIEEIEMIQSFALDKDYYAKFSALRAEHDAQMDALKPWVEFVELIAARDKHDSIPLWIKDQARQLLASIGK